MKCPSRECPRAWSITVPGAGTHSWALRGIPAPAPSLWAETSVPGLLLLEPVTYGRSADGRSMGPSNSAPDSTFLGGRRRCAVDPLRATSVCHVPVASSAQARTEAVLALAFSVPQAVRGPCRPAMYRSPFVDSPRRFFKPGTLKAGVRALALLERRCLDRNGAGRFLKRGLTFQRETGHSGMDVPVSWERGRLSRWCCWLAGAHPCGSCCSSAAAHAMPMVQLTRSRSAGAIPSGVAPAGFCHGAAGTPGQYTRGSNSCHGFILLVLP